jgi:nitroreductase
MADGTPPCNTTADEISRVVRQRRSVRHFTEEELPREQILDLVREASWAPSGGNDQPWAVTALAPPAARAVRERYEMRGWHALVPKLASIHEWATGGDLDLEDAVRGTLGLIADDALTRGAPWLLLVHTSDSPIEDAWVLRMHAALEGHVPARELPTLGEMRATYGPVKAGVTFASAICFAFALCLAAEARGIASCIQHNLLPFRDEIVRIHGLIPDGRILQTAVLVGRADPTDASNVRARQEAQRRPVEVLFADTLE